jgi:hypothetical protein
MKFRGKGEEILESETLARLIAFYLPQFHPIPENDEWWGKGFTEWRNVTKAKPLFRGHKQPKLPADLGFYDLRLPEIRQQQADLAGKYGIEGFCFWHYWFNGKLLLERPVLEIINSGKPDFPFCLAWANEPWSRRWNGEPLNVLQEQVYGGADDDLRHFQWLLPALKDPRAIKINGKPVFLIYKANQIPEIKRTTTLWRELSLKHGLPGLYLLSIETTGTFGFDPRPAGFDAAVEFQPRWDKCGKFMEGANKSLLSKIINKSKYGMRVWDYQKLWPNLLTKAADYPLYPGVFPRWDNSPRTGKKGIVIHNSTPQEYGKWLAKTIQLVQSRPPEQRIVFINAWNEWAEGNYLEPDMEYGHAYLEATLKAVSQDGESGFKNSNLFNSFGFNGKYQMKYQNKIDFSGGSYDNQLGFGWYEIEAGTFRWMAKNAQVMLARPKRNTDSDKYLLLITGSALVDYFQPKSLWVTISVNNKESAKRIIRRNGEFTIEFEFEGILPDIIKVDIQLDQSFIPNKALKSKDTRELGLMINSIRLLLKEKMLFKDVMGKLSNLK